MKKKLINFLLMFLLSASLNLNLEIVKTSAVAENQNTIEATDSTLNTNEAENSLAQSVNKIYAERGEVEDYSNLGLSRVTAENIKWINAETHDRVDLSIAEDKVNERKNSIVKAVNSALNEYSTIKTINDGKDTCDSSDIIEYHTLTGVWVNKSNLPVLQKAVTIGKDLVGRDLTKKEIIELYNKVLSNPDSKYIMQPIRNAIDIAKANSEKLSQEEVQKVIDDTKAKINSSYERIVKGEGSTEDYAFIQITGVNVGNVVWTNAEIKENIDIKLQLEEANGKINNVQNSISNLLKIYPTVKIINDGQETCDSRDIIEYHTLTGVWVNKSNLPLLQKAVTIGKDLVGRDLTKQEIIGLYNRVLNNPDAKYIMQPIRNAIDIAKANSEKLSQEEVQKVIDDTKAKINSSYERIVKGEGSTEDYAFIQITGVNVGNVVWTNAEIKENIDIKLQLEEANGKINNVQNSISNLLKIYPTVKIINDGQETCDSRDIIEYYTLTGVWVNKSNLPLLQMAVTIGKDLVCRDLTKQEIIGLYTKVLNNPDAKYRMKPIRDAIDNAVNKKNRKLTSREVSVIINHYAYQFDKAYENIVKGNASLKDFLLIQINGVNSENIVWVNAEIKENIDIKLQLEKVDGKINNVQTSINNLLDIYNITKIINAGQETCDSRDIIEYYTLTGVWVNKSNLPLLQMAVTIGKDLVGRDLTKQEIIELYNKVLNNPDAKNVMLPIRSAIDIAKVENDKLSPKQVQKVVDETIAKINNAYKRIVKGEASVADYELVQIAGINAENIVWVNAEVKENVDIHLQLEEENGKINNAQVAVGNLLNVYKTVKVVNDGQETCDSVDVIEYHTLTGRWINKRNLPKTREAIAIAKVQKGRDLTKNEIVEILKLF